MYKNDNMCCFGGCRDPVTFYRLVRPALTTPTSQPTQYARLHAFSTNSTLKLCKTEEESLTDILRD